MSPRDYGMDGSDLYDDALDDARQEFGRSRAVCTECGMGLGRLGVCPRSCRQDEDPDDRESGEAERNAERIMETPQ